MTVQHVFKTTSAAHKKVYNEAEAAYIAHRHRIIDTVAALHPGAVAYGSMNRWNGRQTVTGIVGPEVKRNPEFKWSSTRKDTLDPVPEGWRWTKTYDCYRPAQGRAGRVAKDLLHELNSGPSSAVYVLCKHLGMPTEVWLGSHIYWPGAWVDDKGDIWIVYGARLDAKDPEYPNRETELPSPLPKGLKEQPLSAWHLARESVEEKSA